MSDDVLRNIRRLNAEYRLFPRGETVVVGVSGGPDSLCLLHALNALRDDLGIGLHVATLDHMLRPESADDAAFVAETARAWNLRVTVGRADVPALEAGLRLGVEETARQARYTFLAWVARDVGARRIAVAHNADDQSETVLMHFLRGSGLAGLRGMRPIIPLSDYHLLPDTALGGRLSFLDAPGSCAQPSPPGDENRVPGIELPSFQLIRPLLTTTRAGIEAYCAAHGLLPRFDRSNLDTTYFRNRLRHEAIPYLETLNPNLRALLRHTAEVAAADYDALRAQFETAWAQVCRSQSETSIVFDRAGWRALPLSAQRATVREAAYRLNPALRDVSFVHVEDAVHVARDGSTGAQATLPGGVTLRVDYETLALTVAATNPHPPPWPVLWTRDEIPVTTGSVALPDSRWRFTLAPGAGSIAPVLRETWRAALAIPEGARLALRTRRPGDRFAPQGMAGHTQKLADFMINARIPARWRDHIPLLTVNERIAWVAGWRVSHHFAVADDADSYFVASFTIDA